MITTGPRRLRRLAAAALLSLAILVAPDSGPAPTTFSLMKVEGAEAVGFENGVVWVLALGSDARPPEKVTRARADAIELIALDVDNGAAVAIGIPRDSFVDIDGHGFHRINDGLYYGGPELMAHEVEDVTGILPQYVFTTGFSGFAAMVNSIDGVVFRSPTAIVDRDLNVNIQPGPNQLNGREATNLARTRKTQTGGDFARAANHQRLLEAILSKLRADGNDDGFIEAGAVSAVRHLDTELSPTEIYRFAQALTQIKPGKVSRCVIGGLPLTVGGAEVIELDGRQARRVTADADDDAILDQGC